MTTIRKRTAILAGALLMLGVTAPVCAHAQSDQQQQQQQKLKKTHPPARPAQREQQPQQKPPRQQERTQQRDQQRQQQKQQRRMEKQQAKQQQQEQKRVQKQQQEQQKQQRAQQRQQRQRQRNYQQPQRGQQQRAQRQPQGRPQGRGNRGDPRQVAHYEQAHFRQYRPRGREREVRIPDPQYHEYFGEEHRFRVADREDVDGFWRFQYESFWFVLEEPWPEYWYDTDDFYVIYTDDEYFLCDYDDPGFQIQLVVVMDED